MKLLFWGIRSCLGGTATVNPAAEDRGNRRQIEGNGGHVYGTDQTITSKNKSRVVQVKARRSRNWQPKLHAISEDHSPTIGRSTLAQRKPKSTAKTVRRQQNHDHDDYYWKNSGAIAMPAFSPTPFLI